MAGGRLVAVDRTRSFEKYIQEFGSYSTEELKILAREHESRSLMGGFMISFFDSCYDVRNGAIRHVLKERSLLNRIH